MITGNEISLKQGDSVTYKEGKVAQYPHIFCRKHYQNTNINQVY